MKSFQGVSFVILATLGAGASAYAACPNFQMKDYVCSNPSAGTTATITLAATQDSQGRDAIAMTTNGQTNTLTCANDNESQAVCTADQRAASADAAAQCDSEFGAGNSGTISAASTMSDIALSDVVTISSSSGATIDLLSVSLSQNGADLDIVVAATANQTSSSLGVTCQ